MTASVVITTYNRSAKVRNAINSALAYVTKRTITQVIVVDDCSTDTTIADLESVYASEIQTGTVKLVTHDCNLGVTGAKNTGYKLAACDWVIFLDSDDVLIPDMHKELSEALCKYSEQPIIFFRCSGKDGNLVGKKFEHDYMIDLPTYIEHTSFGEALVAINKRIVRSTPYIEGLRGYEGLGCARIIDAHGPAVLSVLRARIYEQESDDRLSSLNGFLDRMHHIAKGHRMMLEEYGGLMRIKTRVSYMFKSVTYKMISYIYNKLK